MVVQICYGQVQWIFQITLKEMFNFFEFFIEINQNFFCELLEVWLVWEIIHEFFILNNLLDILVKFVFQNILLNNHRLVFFMKLVLS